MDCLFIKVYEDLANSSVGIETLITLFIYKLIDTEKVQLVIQFCSQVPSEPTVIVDLSNINYKSLTSLPEVTSCCVWPIIVSKKNVAAGLCSVARLLVKKSEKTQVRALLGFREACLLACSESSVWTRFCEVDAISTAKKLILDEYFVDRKFYLPEDVARFEFHMSKPVRMHNVYKAARERNNDKDINSSIPIQELNLTHSYGEGMTMTLADVILFPCYKIFFSKCPLDLLRDKIPLTIEWFRRMERCDLPTLKFMLTSTTIKTNEIVEPRFAKHSLYTADPSRYRPEKRIYTKQNDIDVAVKAVSPLENEIVNEILPFGHDLAFDWSEIPLEANPSGGALPEKRAKRKQEQLENLVKAVVKIAGNKRYRIVDFCSGSGHLGILLAVLLPNCDVVLVENKECSLSRARERVAKLELGNVIAVQSNLDYFCGDFDIGVTLHACGVATDLVIQNCVEKNAHFVVCPCCYGGIKDCHHLKYPRSKQFQKLDLGYKNYLSLAHAADQTHEADNAKTKQGYLCMDIVDTDRRLFAQSCDYKVHLGKLQPTSCTNKNNLLIGLYRGKE
ncbi:glutathione S-transferase C-terminal domain-containing protein homolog [Anoplophora glabripennis]|uniref:glutathione S-transferase C-terminal domain-containing protein homolog n=1 Tax=Anoplophora glabripennis TaxID=217634 RepID=UPI0008735135|nr:glutathione S-transferase C-terminal domain-containing protein homolog [Anoplophora glabripennis]